MPSLVANPGNDGLERPLSWRVNIRMAIDQRKQFAAILKHKAKTVSHQSRAHSAEVRLNHGHHHSVLVRHGEVSGVAMIRSLAGIRRRQNPVGSNQLGALGRIFLRVQPLHRNLRKIRVGVIAAAVFIGQALGLDLRVDRGRRLKAHIAKIEVLQNIQNLQGSQSLRVCGHCIDIHSAIRSHQRLVPLGVLIAQIVIRKPPADTLEIGIDGAGDWSFVVGITTAFGNHSIGTRQVGVAEHISFTGGFSGGRIGMLCIGRLLHSGARPD